MKPARHGSNQFARPLAVWLIPIGNSLLQAQIGNPIPVTYTIVDTGNPDDLGSLRRLDWGHPQDRWTASFAFPKGWRMAEFWKGPDPKITLTVKAPDGTEQRMPVNFPRMGYALEGINGEFMGEVDWRTPEMAHQGFNNIYYAEDAELGTWRLSRVIWRVGGVSGDPPMHFIMVIQDRASRRWLAQMDEYQYPPAPDGSDALKAIVADDGSLSVSWWNYHGINTAVVEGWRFTAPASGPLVRQDLEKRYALFTRTGRISTFAPTPAEARHVGFQEVAWSIRSWNLHGGVAEAFAESPRRLVTKEDHDGAPILPAPGQRPFIWAAELYVVPWGGKAKRMSLVRALPLLKQRRWDVVLFQTGKAAALATRLVEQHRDFPHSTPKP